MRFIVTLFAVLFSTASALVAEPEPITVFAAASLRGALDNVVQTYDSTVHLSYGGSGTMARQIVAGAPVDVVVLANVQWMHWLKNNAPVLPGSPVSLTANQLVLIGHVTQVAPYEPTDLLSQLGVDGRLAMGQRDAVPAGSYAREWLQHSGQWNNVMGRLAETDNVRAALALVARGQAPIGIVYATDALAEPDVHILTYLPKDSHSPIIYPAAALTAEGQVFLNHLMSPSGQNIFAAHGFVPVPE